MDRELPCLRVLLGGGWRSLSPSFGQFATLADAFWELDLRFTLVRSVVVEFRVLQVIRRYRSAVREGWKGKGPIFPIFVRRLTFGNDVIDDTNE